MKNKIKNSIRQFSLAALCVVICSCGAVAQGGWDAWDIFLRDGTEVRASPLQIANDKTLTSCLGEVKPECVIAERSEIDFIRFKSNTLPLPGLPPAPTGDYARDSVVLLDGRQTVGAVTFKDIRFSDGTIVQNNVEINLEKIAYIKFANPEAANQQIPRVEPPKKEPPAPEPPPAKRETSAPAPTGVKKRKKPASRRSAPKRIAGQKRTKNQTGNCAAALYKEADLSLCIPVEQSVADEDAVPIDDAENPHTYFIYFRGNPRSLSLPEFTTKVTITDFDKGFPKTGRRSLSPEEMVEQNYSALATSVGLMAIEEVNRLTLDGIRGVLVRQTLPKNSFSLKWQTHRFHRGKAQTIEITVYAERGNLERAVGIIRSARFGKE